MRGVVLDASLETWAIIWLATAVFLFARHWRGGRSAGLLLTYVASFGSIHWLGALMYLAPWYSAPGSDLVAEGMRQSALAMLAFAVGGELAVWIFERRHPYVPTLDDHFQASLVDDEEVGEPVHPGMPVNPAAATLFLCAGLVFYGGVAPLAGRIPTLAALVNTGSTLTVAGICLKCWNAWQLGQRRTIVFWLGVSAVLPFITVLTQGFLGYGMAAMVTVFAFVAAFYGPRWKAILASLFIAYLGLSLYVTYMRDRVDIRAVVWTGGAMTDRFSRLSHTVTSFEWFDPYNNSHLARMDDRLNQNYLIGAAAAHIGGGQVSLAYGSTLIDAALALVPRFLWPEKPVNAGSGDLVSIYTGMGFSGETSVGIGQVMECYVNFSTMGVIGGFLLMGMLVVFVDRSAHLSLEEGDAGHFAMWYLPGLSLLLVGGSFVEMTSGAAAAIVVAAALNAISRRLPHRTAGLLDRRVEPFGDIPEMHL